MEGAQVDGGGDGDGVGVVVVAVVVDGAEAGFTAAIQRSQPPEKATDFNRLVPISVPISIPIPMPMPMTPTTMPGGIGRGRRPTRISAVMVVVSAASRDQRSQSGSAAPAAMTFVRA